MNLKEWDIELFRAINQSMGDAWLDPFMTVISSNRFWAVLALLWIAIGIYKKKKSWGNIGAKVALAIALSDGLSFFVMKPYFNRIRPCYELENIRLVPESCGGEQSFPSNHAANGMAAFVAAYTPAMPSYNLPILVMVLLVGFSRVYLGVHYPFDVLGGFATGALMGLLVRALFKYGQRLKLAGQGK